MKNARKETHHRIKIWKNAICMLMAVVMIIVYVPNDMLGIQNISKVEAAVSYNADSAASYALTYTDATGGYGTETIIKHIVILMGMIVPILYRSVW